MIQYHHDVVWVKEADGRTVPFDPSRLSASVERAASLAGCAGCSLGESLAAALEMFALNIAKEPVLAAGDIAQFVETVLNSIGYSTIARMYSHRKNHVEIRLEDMASRVTTGFELGFYQRLDHALDVVNNSGTTLVQIRGLRECVLKLRGARRWSDRCGRLADDIVDHVRMRAAHLRTNTASSLHLTVLE